MIARYIYRERAFSLKGVGVPFKIYLNFFVLVAYTASNAPDLMQVVDFTGFMQLSQKNALRLLASGSFIKSVKINICLVLQIVEATSMKLVDKKYRQSTCIKPVFKTCMQQTGYHPAEASDANIS